MCFRTVFLALVLSVLTLAAAVPHEIGSNYLSSRIVGGEPAQLRDFTYIVSLSRAGAFFCAGTLIDISLVLTTASCVYGKPIRDVVVRYDSLSKSSGGKTVGVSSGRVHPSYSPSTAALDYDVAILYLASPVPSTYATLPTQGQGPAVGSTASIAGWGVTSTGGTSPNLLQKVESVPIMPRSQCQALYPAGYVTNNLFCVGYGNGGSDACQGDSGSPIVRYPTKELIGIVGFGYGCGKASTPGVYVLVGTLVTWIKNNWYP